jgi:hypothetical protein
LQGSHDGQTAQGACPAGNESVSVLLALKQDGGAFRRNLELSLGVIAHFLNLTPGRSSLMNSTPACFERVLDRVEIGRSEHQNVSKSAIAAAGTTAALARSACDKAKG